jgi:predicted acylesterase/phospholipase RssA
MDSRLIIGLTYLIIRFLKRPMEERLDFLTKESSALFESLPPPEALSVRKIPFLELPPDTNCDTPLVDIGLATSAAPTFFPEHLIGDAIMVDGGLIANAPRHACCLRGASVGTPCRPASD